MAQQVKLMGAIYSDVPAVLLPDNNDVMHRFDDASVTTATAADVASGKTFLAADGTITTGTSSGGGGSSAWTKVAENSYAVSTTSTSTATVDTLSTGHSELWTSDKWVYVRIRDTAGKRNGYFYGSDSFFYNTHVVNGTTQTSSGSGIRIFTRYNDGTFTPTAQTSTNGYGVYADYIYNDGRVRIRKRYNSTSTLTINGTYKVEVYLLDPPGGIPLFT